MKLYHFKTKDGQRYVNVEFSREDRDYNGTFKALDTMDVPRLFPGYDNVRVTELYPGMPILTRYHQVKDWDIFQPSTYKYDNLYLSRSVEQRGTYTTDSVTAYHVGGMATFQKKELYEVPNTPCEVRTVTRRLAGSTSVVTQPAHYTGEGKFVLLNDIAILEMNIPTLKEILFFYGTTPKFVDGTVVGSISAGLDLEPGLGIEHMVIVSPLVKTPPEKAYFTGSSSGSGTLRLLKDLGEYSYKMHFGTDVITMTFLRGWLYEGQVLPGDSGGPVFTLAGQ